MNIDVCVVFAVTKKLKDTYPDCYNRLLQIII